MGHNRVGQKLVDHSIVDHKRTINTANSTESPFLYRRAAYLLVCSHVDVTQLIARPLQRKPDAPMPTILGRLVLAC